MNNTLRFNHHHHNKGGATAILTARHLHNITAVFRAVEFLLFLAVISRFSVMLPVALQFSGDYFRSLAVTVVSPHFVFVVGNAIVITLFVKSGGRLSHPNHSSEVCAGVTPAPEKSSTFIVSVYSSSPSGKTTKTTAAAPNPLPAKEVKIKCYQRSKSEKMNLTPVTEKKSGAGGIGAVALRRTKTERHVRNTCKGNYPEDNMSSEEFRQTIEDFIARQQRFLREEEEDETLAVVQ